MFGDLSNPQNRERTVDAYLSTEKVRGLGIDLNVLRERLLRDGKSFRDFFATILATHADLQGKTYTGEKTPRHSLWVGTLLEWFPGCSIIHLVRDPRDCASSMIGMPWSSRSALVAARIWRCQNAAAATVSQKDNYYRVRYEDLVTTPEEQLARICEHAGLCFSPAMLDAGEPRNDRPWWHRRAYEGLTTTRLGLWRRELAPWQVAVVERVTCEWMDAFGYQRQFSHVPLPDLARGIGDAVLRVTCLKLLHLPATVVRFVHPGDLETEEKWRDRAIALVRHRDPERQPVAKVTSTTSAE